MSAIDNFTSEIRLWAGSRLPQYWLACNGQSLSVADHQPLFDQIGYRYGGSGATFALPNLVAPTNLRYMICTLGIRPDPNGGLGTALMGEIRYLVGLPTGCRDAVPADGRLLNINAFIATFTILGTRFGGNGTSTFALPTLPGLSPANGPAIAPLFCVFGIYPQPDAFYSDAYISEIRQMALQFTARGWLPCLGESLQINFFAALYSLVGDRFDEGNNQRFLTPNLPNVGEIPFVMNAQGLYPDAD